ncbi:MAG: hypothetical protein MASP_00226 [Candidatus Methanolliviera sp. GoM_asphalt]|nr:MAG: hypothetical protein MASP_00226 [Candidatus Methanolliviera sp. GoM_asphalt]
MNLYMDMGEVWCPIGGMFGECLRICFGKNG